MTTTTKTTSTTATTTIATPSLLDFSKPSSLDLHSRFSVPKLPTASRLTQTSWSCKTTRKFAAGIANNRLSSSFDSVLVRASRENALLTFSCLPVCSSAPTLFWFSFSAAATTRFWSPPLSPIPPLLLQFSRRLQLLLLLYFFLDSCFHILNLWFSFSHALFSSGLGQICCITLHQSPLLLSIETQTRALPCSVFLGCHSTLFSPISWPHPLSRSTALLFVAAYGFETM